MLPISLTPIQIRKRLFEDFQGANVGFGARIGRKRLSTWSLSERTVGCHGVTRSELIVAPPEVVSYWLNDSASCI